MLGFSKEWNRMISHVAAKERKGLTRIFLETRSARQTINFTKKGGCI